MTAVGSPLHSQAPQTAEAEPARIVFLGAPFDLRPLPDVLDRLRAREAGDPFRYVVTPNVDHVNQIDAHPEILPYYRDAWQCWCDSQIVRRLGLLFGHRLPLINGSDGVRHIFADVVRPGDRIALIAAHPEILTELRAHFPELLIDGHCPPMGFAENPEAVEACIDFAVTSRGRFLFVAVGAPRSERLCHLIAVRPGATGTAFCIGAAMEFIVGNKTRAPRLFQRLGLEWLHRLLSEPRRLWRRYLLGALPLACLVWREAFAHRNRAYLKR